MFIFLNRVLKGFVIACWLAAAFAVWTQRERGRPLVDQYELWRDVNWSQPPALPRLEMSVVRMLGPTAVTLKGADRRVMNVALLGMETNGVPYSLAGLKWIAGTTTNMSSELKGRTVDFAWTTTNASGIGQGFLLVDGTNLLHKAVREGWYALKPEDARVLPVGEQYILRLEDRAARAAGVGRWRIINAPVSTPTPAAQ